MKYFAYVWRNVRRNKLRTFLTMASVSICCFLMVVLLAFIYASEVVAVETRPYNRLITISSQGFSQELPISLVSEVAGWEEDGVVGVTPLSWFGGKLGDEPASFAQFGVYADTIFSIYEEQKVPADQLAAFKADRASCIIGRKLANEKSMKVGDNLPLKGDIYPVDLDLKIVGIYDGPETTDLRTVYFHWEYLDEILKQSPDAGGASGNAGAMVVRCSGPETMLRLVDKIDGSTQNSTNPSRTQDEEAFSRMFTEMLGDMKYYVYGVGVAVIFSLLCASGVAMAMSMRERTTEIAVLKAIGFGGGLVLSLVLAESILIAGLGGLLGTLGTKVLAGLVDLTQFTGAFLPYFFVPWWVVGMGVAAALFIGFASGIVPAVLAARLPVIDGLRKVV